MGLIAKPILIQKRSFMHMKSWAPNALMILMACLPLLFMTGIKKKYFLPGTGQAKNHCIIIAMESVLFFPVNLGALNNQLSLQIDEQHLQQYVRMGYFYKSSTPYKNVWELPAGSYAYVSLQNPEVKVQRWWNIHDFISNNQRMILRQRSIKLINYFTRL